MRDIIELAKAGRIHEAARLYAEQNHGDPPDPADYIGVIIFWAEHRLADDMETARALADWIEARPQNMGDT